VEPNVADPGCLSRIPDPDYTHPGSRIQKQQQKRGVKKNCCHTGTFLCSHRFHKIENYFRFEMLKKKIWVNFQRIVELFTPKIVTKLLKIWVWDPGSEIRDPEKTYSGCNLGKFEILRKLFNTGMWIQIRLGPHYFCKLDPDPH
jgi:hypothetical protein